MASGCSKMLHTKLQVVIRPRIGITNLIDNVVPSRNLFLGTGIGFLLGHRCVTHLYLPALC
jgi:hypothetical protein